MVITHWMSCFLVFMATMDPLSVSTWIHNNGLAGSSDYEIYQFAFEWARCLAERRGEGQNAARVGRCGLAQRSTGASRQSSVLLLLRHSTAPSKRRRT